MKAIVSGLMSFQQLVNGKYRALFGRLADYQAPELLLLTCSDSRIDPGLMTQTQPGDIFVCRNAGNLVPPHSLPTDGTLASIEFALLSLDIRHLVVCGHTDCRAIKGALNRDAPGEAVHLRNWLKYIEPAVEQVRLRYGGNISSEHLNEVAAQHVVHQLERLKEYPLVASRLAEKSLTLHGWMYQLEAGQVTCYEEETGQFVPVNARYRNYLQ